MLVRIRRKTNGLTIAKLRAAKKLLDDTAAKPSVKGYQLIVICHMEGEHYVFDAPAGPIRKTKAELDRLGIKIIKQ